MNTEIVERIVLGDLCEQLPLLREQFAGSDEARELDAIEAAARARLPVTALLEDLLGVSMTDTVRGVSTGLPGAAGGRADEESYGCPDRACDRIAHTVPAGAAPTCRLTGVSMVRR
ncbi:hypothetical protein F4553_000033 [Allocatelliglobosispora scoriae]|uniref:Uncharacterized protein n=1 Tax=Allocatelliglobosispora scoriae TaxID=643052 RepID=A0A841BED6_9ACTN|nr:hypothetical protein [Allocatelliglobosispora scoriae]MBB5866654.1 hypothetical protein [Allocatelliglobosispora scoriae]